MNLTTFSCDSPTSKETIVNFFVCYADIAIKTINNSKSKANEEESLEECLRKNFIADDVPKYNKFLSQIRNILNHLDAASVSLAHIFYRNQKPKHEQHFKMFLLNLEIWGSYDSLDVTDDKIFTLELARS